MTTVPSGIWPIDPNVTTGTDLATYLNTWMDAFQSMQASPTRPPLITKGGVWAKTIGAADIALMFFDGAADHAIGSVIGGSASFGGVVASATAPTPATLGATWIDTSVAGFPVLKVYSGTVWGEIGPDATGTINAEALTVNGNKYPSAGALSDRNLIINGLQAINQRGVAIGAAAAGSYGPDRWKRVASGNMTQIIEAGTYNASATYTLSGTNVTTQQITSPAGGNWTLPEVAITATAVQLELGTVATPYIQRQLGSEMALCQRYYERGGASAVSYASSAAAVQRAAIYFSTQKRAAPAVTVTGTGGTATGGSAINVFTQQNGFTLGFGSTAASQEWIGEFIADAEL
jgi:hypothetical protein